MVTHYFFLLLAFPAMIFSYGTAESNVGPSKKHSINFYGTLEVHQGNIFEVDNISIQDLYRQIPMYDCPGEGFLEKATLNKETGKMEIHLKENPADITKIDLEETEEICVDREPLYVFQQPQHRPTYFYRATIISKSNQTKHYSLVSEHAKLTCDEIDSAGPREKDVHLSSIKSLKIKGFSQRMDKEQTKTDLKK
jgi:hypothetical protein